MVPYVLLGQINIYILHLINLDVYFKSPESLSCPIKMFIRIIVKHFKIMSKHWHQSHKGFSRESLKIHICLHSDVVPRRSVEVFHLLLLIINWAYCNMEKFFQNSEISLSRFLSKIPFDSGDLMRSWCVVLKVVGLKTKYIYIENNNNMNNHRKRFLFQFQIQNSRCSAQ